MAVDAVARASDKDTEEGSLRSMLAVLRASCFCCMDVPWLAAADEGGGAAVDNFPKRDERLPKEGDCVVVGGALVEDLSLHGFAS